jgi:hypothetical protein
VKGGRQNSVGLVRPARGSAHTIAALGHDMQSIASFENLTTLWHAFTLLEMRWRNMKNETYLALDPKQRSQTRTFRPGVNAPVAASRLTTDQTKSFRVGIYSYLSHFLRLPPPLFTII